MLSPDYLDHCADDILRLYEQLDDDIIRDIVRRLVDTDFEMTQSAVWQAEKIQEIGNTVYSDVLNRISDITGKSEDELRTLFEDAGTETMVYDDSVYRRAGLNPLPVMQSPGMLQVLTAGYKKCGESLHNLTLTTANTSQAAYIQACNRAYMQVSSGAFDYATAIRKSVEELSKTGSYILYPSGNRDRIDVAVRRSVLTGVSQTCGQLQIMRMDEMEWGIIDVTAHMGARPEHAQWQGGRFSYKGRNKRYPDFETSTGYGTGEGLCGYGCRHNFYPGLESDVRMYSDAQLDEWKNHTVEYNGDKYTDYEASQVQRKMERDIRETKRTLTGIDEARKNAPEEALKKGFSDDFGVQSIRLKQQEAKLSDFLAQTGRAEDRSRVQVAGFGKSQAQKAVNANKRLQSGSKNGIIKNQRRKPMNILPNAEKVEISKEKFTAYALNKTRNYDKAVAFEKALGYNQDNVDKLIDNIYRNVKNFEAIKKPDNGYGQRYSVLMSLVGENGKKANVQTAWIIDKKTNITRLTSAYITNKKIGV